MAEAWPPGAPGAPGTAAPAPQPQRLCASAELAERGPARVWDLLLYGQPARAFALRVDGTVRAYVNRCAHVPVELDWVPGEFLDEQRQWIICSVHGATYSPADGRCVGGPCGRGRLMPVAVQEAGGEVTWYPSRDLRPLPPDASPPAAPTG